MTGTVVRAQSLAWLEVSINSIHVSRNAGKSHPPRGRSSVPSHLGGGMLPTRKQGSQGGFFTCATEEVRDISTSVVSGATEIFAAPSKVEELLAEQRVADAWRAFMSQASTGAFPPRNVVDDLIRRLSTSHRYVEARKAYRMIDMRGPLLRYNTYQSLLNACLSANDLDTAVDVFRDIQSGGMAPNKVTYCGLISALGKQRRRGSRYPELAYELWQELRDEHSTSGETLDAISLRTGMKACVDVGKVEEAEKLVEQAIWNRSPAAKDVRTYNILLKGYSMTGSSGKRKKQLQNVMQRMRTTEVQPSCVTYNILIDSHVRCGDVTAARECMKAATAAGIKLDAWSYTSLIKGCVESEDMYGATAVIEDMRVSGVKPTYITYSTLIDGYAKAGDMAEAREVLQTMIYAGEQPSAVTYNSMLRGYAMSMQSGSLSEALQLLDDMQIQGVSPAVDTFNTLMSAAVGADEGHLALDLHQRMLAAGLRPDGVTFTVMLQAHGRLGQVSEAVAAFESLSRDPNAAMDITAYNAMVAAFAQSGDMTAAESMLQRACSFAKRVGLPPPREAFGAVVAGYVRLKQVSPAVQTVRKFNAAGGTPDVQMLDMLVNLCVHLGEFKIALQAVRSMELIGAEVDKEKYKAMVVKKMERAAATASRIKNSEGDGRRNGIGDDLSRRRQPAGERKSVYLERFKFWLGLPNNYYNDSETDGSW